MWFFKTNAKIMDESSVLCDQMHKLKLLVKELEQDVVHMKQNIKILRGFVNRKLKIDPTDPEEEEKEDLEIPEVSAFNDGFDDIRKITKEAKQ